MNRVYRDTALDASQSRTVATGSSKSARGSRAMTCQVNASWWASAVSRSVARSSRASASCLAPAPGLFDGGLAGHFRAKPTEIRRVFNGQIDAGRTESSPPGYAP